MFHPSRGGVRGGQDQFSWDNVKEDKYRENYLGHSLKAPVGRWQKGKDLTWYAKNGNERDEARAAELRAIKEAEEEAMLEALGYPSKKKSNTALIDAKELNTILHKGHQAGEEETDKETFEIKGLGYKDSASKSLTGKTETTKFTSGATISSNIPTVSSKNSSITYTKEDDQQGALSDASKSPKKHKEKKHKKSKSKSKKKRHDSDDENVSEAKRHKSPRSKNTEPSSRHSRDSASRYTKEENAERSYSSRDRQIESEERMSRSSYRVRSREDRPTRYCSRSPRREDFSRQRSSRY